MHAKQHLQRVNVADLRPTQMTVGAIEVAAKRRQWAGLKPKARAELLDTHWFPTVIGPKGECFIVDHHHLGQALMQEKVPQAWAVELANYTGMEQQLFWRLMSFKHWAHPFDEHGVICQFSNIPQSLIELRDDPYRSLAGVVRTSGGFAKDSEPYVEFLWADFFRQHFTLKELAPNAKGTLASKVLSKAIDVARSPLAQDLPGWSGATAATPAKVPTASKKSKS